MTDFSKRDQSQNKKGIERAVSEEELDRLAKIEAERLTKEFNQKVKELIEKRKKERWS